MALRVTLQSVEALVAYADNPSALRVTRQCVEVLTALGTNLSSSSTLSLSETAAYTRGGSVAAAATSTLAFVGTAYFPPFARDTLTLIVSASSSRATGRCCADTLTLDASAVGGKLRTRSAASAFTLSQALGYIGPKSVAAVTTLALVDGLHRCQPLIVSAGSLLTVSATTGLHGANHLAASSTLSLHDLADRGIYVRGVTTEIVLTDALKVDYCRTAKDQLVLTDQAKKGQFTVLASSSLQLSQTIAGGSRLRAAQSVLTLTDNVATNRYLRSAADTLVIGDSSRVKGPTWASAVDVLQLVTEEYDPTSAGLVQVITGLQDAAGVSRLGVPSFIHQYISLTDGAELVRLKQNAIAVDASDHLNLSHEPFKSQTGNSLSFALLNDFVRVDKCNPLTSKINLDSLVSVTVQRSIGLGSSLSVQHGVAFLIGGNAAMYQYRPFIGEGAVGAPPPPPATLSGPMPGTTAPFQLVYPSTGSVTDSVTLRAPELGNKDRLAFNRVSRETRGGTLIVFADPMWPNVQTLVLTFTALKKCETRELLSFLENHLGLEIGLVDWEARYWRVVTTTPGAEAIQDSINSFTVHIEFEGVLDPTSTYQAVI